MGTWLFIWTIISWRGSRGDWAYQSRRTIERESRICSRTNQCGGGRDPGCWRRLRTNSRWKWIGNFRRVRSGSWLRPMGQRLCRRPRRKWIICDRLNQWGWGWDPGCWRRLRTNSRQKWDVNSRWSRSGSWLRPMGQRLCRRPRRKWIICDRPNQWGWGWDPGCWRRLRTNSRRKWDVNLRWSRSGSWLRPMGQRLCRRPRRKWIICDRLNQWGWGWDPGCWRRLRTNSRRKWVGNLRWSRSGSWLRLMGQRLCRRPRRKWTICDRSNLWRWGWELRFRRIYRVKLRRKRWNDIRWIRYRRRSYFRGEQLRN